MNVPKAGEIFKCGTPGLQSGRPVPPCEGCQVPDQRLTKAELERAYLCNTCREALSQRPETD